MIELIFSDFSSLILILFTLLHTASMLPNKCWIHASALSDLGRREPVEALQLHCQAARWRMHSYATVLSFVTAVYYKFVGTLWNNSHRSRENLDGAGAEGRWTTVSFPECIATQKQTRRRRRRPLRQRGRRRSQKYDATRLTNHSSCGPHHCDT